MVVRIISNTQIAFEQIAPIEESALVEAFSVQNPKSRYLDPDGPYDGWHRKYNASKRTMSRALLGEVIKLCRAKGFTFSLYDQRPPPKRKPPDISLVTPDLLPGITLEEYQLRALRAACRAEVGLISATTGAGKSEIMAGITKIANCPTVIIAEQTIVVQQLKERLELRKVVEEVGLFMAGKRPNGQMVIIGSLASLCVPWKAPERTEKDDDESFKKKLMAFRTRAKNAKILREMVGKCEMLLIDEADRATNKIYRNLLRFWFKGRRRYGFSGSFFDPAKPVQNLELKNNLGSVIAETLRAEVLAQKRIIPIHYTAFAFGDPNKKQDKTAYDIALDEQIINNPRFHLFIKKLVELSLKTPGYGTVILCEYIPLGKILEQIIPGSKFIHGETTKRARGRALEQFEKREIRVLIGSKIIRRGLDLDGGCETLIVATDVQLWSEFVQMLGRGARINKVGSCNVWDLYHMSNHYLYDHSRHRLKHVLDIDPDARIIFPHGKIDVQTFVKSRFRIPKQFV